LSKFIFQMIFYFTDADSCFSAGLTTPDGWLVWLRRVDGSVSFDRDWADYKAGFGDYNGNLWLGLCQLHTITNSGNYKLRAEMEAWGGEKKWAEYGTFRVAAESDNYRLTIDDYNSDSTAYDYMYYDNNRQFTTRDADHDGRSDGNCAVPRGGGGWWYNWCSYVTATAVIGNQGDSGLPYMFWYAAFNGDPGQALKSMTLMIRTKN